MPVTLITEVVQNSVSFDDFWSIYPRRQAKKDAMKAWNRIDSSRRDQILRGVRAWMRSEQWCRDDGRYIPMPATFLNGERWEDEVEISISAKPCNWPRCKSGGSQQYGSRDFCEAHMTALKRGETPS